MIDEQFQILNAAFESALTLEAEERAAFLERFKRQHPVLAEQLQTLLEKDGEEQDLVEMWVHHQTTSLSQSADDAWIGRVLGNWLITARIGAGGMGAVFRAERADREYVKTTAIKVLSGAISDARSIERFRVERQILANLNHPGIALLIDGGTTESGIPYLVMEYVDGVRIDAYCDENRLSIPDRLGLMIQVCGAVEYAHRNHVVHRDIKPSNVLVSRTGQPKLLDFGIAKLQEPGDSSLIEPNAGPGQRLMTPEYASPEQVKGEAISRQTDIYSLGVLLFRLLTGGSPYASASTSREDVERAILEHDPAKLSTLVSRASASNLSNADTVALKRAESTHALRKLLSGDLDNIVLKCLQKDPNSRYESAGQLAADLTSFLDHEPVSASGTGWIYKGRKFFKRNSRMLLTAAAIAAAMSVAVFGVVIQTNGFGSGVRTIAGFSVPTAVSSDDDVAITGLFKFQNSNRINQFEMIDANHLRVRNLATASINATRAHGQWHHYVRTGPRVFQAETSIATYTLLENGNVVWESNRKITLVPYVQNAG